MKKICQRYFAGTATLALVCTLLTAATVRAAELPPGAQRVTVFAAGIPTKSSQPEAARALILWLSSPAAYPAIRKNGLTPVTIR